MSRQSAQLQLLQAHVRELLACTKCPGMHRPVVSGRPVLSKVMLIGQAPGIKEGPAGKPFAWTAGKTMFGWFAGLGIEEEAFRSLAYMAAVCRCFPGKATGGGGDRVPSPNEIAQCSHHLQREVELLQPELIVPVGKLAIGQVMPSFAGGKGLLTDIIGTRARVEFHGHPTDVIALPHPSGASTWHRVEPGKSLLTRALAQLGEHPAFLALVEEARRLGDKNAVAS